MRIPKWLRGAFTHIVPYPVGNSFRGIQVASRTTGRVDQDYRMPRDGWHPRNTHFPAPLRKGFHWVGPEPAPDRNTYIEDMTQEQVGFLRYRDGRHIGRFIDRIGQAQGQRLVRYEFEAKIGKNKRFEDPEVWRRIANMIDWGYWDGKRHHFIVKTLLKPGCGEILKAAHEGSGGRITVVLLSGHVRRLFRRLPERYRHYVTGGRGYVRGPAVRWKKG